MAREWRASAQWTFREKEYTVSAELQEGLLSVQVEEGFTADRWRGSFEPKRETTCFSSWKGVELA